MRRSVTEQLALAGLQESATWQEQGRWPEALVAFQEALVARERIGVAGPAPHGGRTDRGRPGDSIKNRLS